MADNNVISLYSNPNIEYYRTVPELDNRIVPHCALLLREYVRGDVLDVGAGHGAFTAALTNTNMVRRVVACDINNNNLCHLRKKHYITKRVNLDEYPYNVGGPYDTIISADVIEHLLSPYLHLVELHRLLKPGGRLILVTPQVPRCNVTVPHIGYFSPESLEMMFRRVGFVSSTRIYNGVYSPQLTKITSKIPLLRNVLSVGCYYVVQKSYDGEDNEPN